LIPVRRSASLRSVETYEVKGKGPVVEAISAALKASGAKILSAPDSPPKTAPFLYSVELPSGERVNLVCYAFTANKYEQAGRPTDEHRLQVKYGSDFKRYHYLYFDPSEKTITLFFGFHLEEKIFVAVDPRAHNPTWFSKSIEFKDEHVAQIKKLGWFGWERQRIKKGRRKIVLVDRGEESFTSAAMLGFKAKHFVRYIELERAVSGLPSSERLAFIAGSSPAKQPRTYNREHALEETFDLPIKQILDVIVSKRRVMMNVLGSIAEVHLHNYLRSVKGLTKIRQTERDAPPDFEVTFRRQSYGIECKNLLRRPGRPKVDFQRTRAPKGDPCGRYYSVASFDVLAACMQPVTGHWNFEFCPTRALRPHESCEGRISPNIYLDESKAWSPDVLAVLERAR
jgi:hypothetical protein